MEGLRSLRIGAGVLGVIGVALVVTHLAMVFFYVPTERTLGIIQKIFYVHVPFAWVTFVAFGLVALTSAMYLLMGEDRLDQAAVSFAEGGLVFGLVFLITGSLWGKASWGTWWQFDPRMTFSLLLWFIYVGYFMVRLSVQDPARGKKLAAWVGIVGALDIPVVHLSVNLPSLHPQAVVLKQERPTLEPEMLLTLAVSVLAVSCLFASVFLLRYATERVERGS